MPEDVEFEIDQRSQNQYGMRMGPPVNLPPRSKMADWLLRVGIIKNEENAGVVLIVIVALNFILAGIILFIFVF